MLKKWRVTIVTCMRHYTLEVRRSCPIQPGMPAPTMFLDCWFLAIASCYLQITSILLIVHKLIAVNTYHSSSTTLPLMPKFLGTVAAPLNNKAVAALGWSMKKPISNQAMRHMFLYRIRIDQS